MKRRINGDEGGSSRERIQHDQANHARHQSQLSGLEVRESVFFEQRAQSVKPGSRPSRRVDQWRVLTRTHYEHLEFGNGGRDAVAAIEEEGDALFPVEAPDIDGHGFAFEKCRDRHCILLNTLRQSRGVDAVVKNRNSMRWVTPTDQVSGHSFGVGEPPIDRVDKYRFESVDQTSRSSGAIDPVSPEGEFKLPSPPDQQQEIVQEQAIGLLHYHQVVLVDDAQTRLPQQFIRAELH